jgi:hypothetical protein
MHIATYFSYIIIGLFLYIVHYMPYLSKSGLLKVQDSKIYVFMPHDLKVFDPPKCLKVLKYGIYETCWF